MMVSREAKRDLAVSFQTIDNLIILEIYADPDDKIADLNTPLFLVSRAPDGSKECVFKPLAAIYSTQVFVCAFPATGALMFVNKRKI